jgi:hypothetical protein
MLYLGDGSGDFAGECSVGELAPDYEMLLFCMFTRMLLPNFLTELIFL